MNYHYKPPKYPQLKRQYPRAGEPVKQLKLTQSITGGNGKWQSYLGKQFGVSNQIKNMSY